MRRLIIAVCGTLLIGIFLAGLAFPQEPVLIGIGHDTSGFSADSGRAERDGAIMCIEEWNAKGGIGGRKIEYLSRDNGGDPTKATTIAKEFVRRGVAAVHGGTTSTVAIPEIKAVSEAQIPIITHSASMAQFDIKGPDGKLYVFAIVTNPSMAIASVEISSKRGYKNLAIVVLNAAWPQDLAKIQTAGIKEEYASLGLKHAGTIVADLKATDLTREAAEVKKLNPDCVLMTMYSSTYVPWFRALNDLNYHPPIIGYWGMLEGAYLAVDPALLYNVYGFSTYDYGKPIVAEKLKNFETRFKYKPTGTWVGGYDMMNILLSGIKEAGTKGPAIRDWIATKSVGMSTIGGNRRAVNRIHEGSEYFKKYSHGIVGPKDWAICHVDKSGKLNWLE